MEPRRVLTFLGVAVVASVALAWGRPLGADAPAWSFLFLVGLLGIVTGLWSAFFLPLARASFPRQVQRVGDLLPAFAIAIPLEWLLKMIARGQLSSAPTSEILLASRIEAIAYVALLVGGLLAFALHMRGRSILLGLAVLTLVPLSVWGTRLDLPMLLGMLLQAGMFILLLMGAFRPRTSDTDATTTT